MEELWGGTGGGWFIVALLILYLIRKSVDKR